MLPLFRLLQKQNVMLELISISRKHMKLSIYLQGSSNRLKYTSHHAKSLEGTGKGKGRRPGKEVTYFNCFLCPSCAGKTSGDLLRSAEAL